MQWELDYESPVIIWYESHVKSHYKSPVNFSLRIIIPSYNIAFKDLKVSSSHNRWGPKSLPMIYHLKPYGYPIIQAKISDDQIRPDPNRCPIGIRSDNLYSDRDPSLGILNGSSGLDPIRSYSRSDKYRQPESIGS